MRLMYVSALAALLAGPAFAQNYRNPNPTPGRRAGAAGSTERRRCRQCGRGYKRRALRHNPQGLRQWRAVGGLRRARRSQPRADRVAARPVRLRPDQEGAERGARPVVDGRHTSLAVRRPSNETLPPIRSPPKETCSRGTAVMPEAFICDYVRTPIGRYAGALKDMRTDDLGAIPLRALMARNGGVDWEAVDDLYYGCANQAGEDNRNVGRMAALLAGLPTSVPAATLNRLCGSGLDAVGTAARAIRAGDADLVLAGGVESMTRAPFVQGKATEAFSRAAEIYDTTIGWRFVNPLLRAQYGVDSMPETAEKRGAGLPDQPLRSGRVRVAQPAAMPCPRRRRASCTREITPVTVTTRKVETVVDRDGASAGHQPRGTREAEGAIPQRGRQCHRRQRQRHGERWRRRADHRQRGCRSQARV